VLTQMMIWDQLQDQLSSLSETKAGQIIGDKSNS
jgi:hypothetical protein